MSSKIEWTDETWNPVDGCTKVSAGCAHCYAATFAHRQMGPWKGRAFTDVRCHPSRLDVPLHWRKPRRVFVNSMSDLFHSDVPDAFIGRVFERMRLAPGHTFQVLTKRPERMLAWLSRCGNGGGLGWITHDGSEPERAYGGTGIIVGDADRWPLPNVWLGVSVENQATADERIPILLQTPAAHRFVSAEPLLEPIDLSIYLASGFDEPPHNDILSWVIVGGESGVAARPCDVAWVRSIVSQCQAADVPAFVKQVGARPIGFLPEARDFPTALINVGFWIKDSKGGDPAEWPEDLRVRQMPEVRP
jgi:protein gp37